MAPRHPPERPDDKPAALKQPIENAPDDGTPANGRRVPESERNEPRLVTQEEVEIDRMEAYLKGPTAFTA